MLTNPSFDKKNKSETGRHYFAESKSKNSSKEMLKKNHGSRQVAVDGFSVAFI